MELHQISNSFAVEISGVDLAGAIDPADQATIRKTFDDHGLIVFRGQLMTKRSLVAATAMFGDCEIHPVEGVRDDEVPQIITLATHGKRGDVVWEDDEEIIGRQYWHTDLGYTTMPCRGALFYGAQLPPEGGETGFVDCAAAYDALDEKTKRDIDPLSIVQSWRFSQSIPIIRDSPAFKTKDGSRSPDIDKFPDVIYPMVMRHGVTGRKTLNVVPQYATDIVEMPGEAGWALIDRLIQHLTQPRFMYWHKWQSGDVLGWDNWRTNHAAAGCKAKYNRVMWRTTIKGDVPYGRDLEPGMPKSSREWSPPGAPLHLPA